jgi:hypothetical protein
MNVLAFVSPSSRNLSLLARSSATVISPGAPRRHHGVVSAAAGASLVASASMLRVSSATRSLMTACCCEWAGNKLNALDQ